MSPLRHLVEPSRLLLTWQPSDEGAPVRTRRVVGEITPGTGSTPPVFRYLKETEDFKAAEAAGFTGFPAFRVNEMEFRHGVLESLMRRLPPRNREDFPDYLQLHGLRIGGLARRPAHRMRESGPQGNVSSMDAERTDDGHHRASERQAAAPVDLRAGQRCMKAGGVLREPAAVMHSPFVRCKALPAYAFLIRSLNATLLLWRIAATPTSTTPGSTSHIGSRHA